MPKGRRKVSSQGQSCLGPAGERRLYRRYIVTGSVVLQTGAVESCGALLNLGVGGMLVRTDTLYQEGTDLVFRFQVGGNPEMFTAFGQVVGTKADRLAIKFLEQPAGMYALLHWLEQRNFIWPGVA